MAIPYDPNCSMSINKDEKDQDHDSSVSAAVVAVHLISSARLARKLDSKYTEYSAQYLVDKACAKEEDGLTVKDCPEYVLTKGIPKAEDWTHSRSLSKPPSSHKPALVTMKGEVIEAMNMEEALELLTLTRQPVGAKLHVFSPHIELQQDGIYCGPSSVEDARYVGLRDGLIVGVREIQGKSIVIVKIWYKQKFTYIKAALSRMFAVGSLEGDETLDCSQGVKPTALLVDFVVPLLSIN